MLNYGGKFSLKQRLDMPSQPVFIHAYNYLAYSNIIVELQELRSGLHLKLLYEIKSAIEKYIYFFDYSVKTLIVISISSLVLAAGLGAGALNETIKVQLGLKSGWF